MKNRTILYGYEIKMGQIQINSSEAEIVTQIFNMYANGKTLNEIASFLVAGNYVYYNGIANWNKNTVNRIIENEKYNGADGYPQIINDNLFKSVRVLKETKSCKKERKTDEVEYFKTISVCGECGSRIKRIKWSQEHEKWICAQGCKCSVYVDDDFLQNAVTKSLTMIITTPDLLNAQPVSKYETTNEVRKEENELGRLKEQQKLNFSVLSHCVLNIASAKFICCKFDKGELTEEIKSAISQLSVSDNYDVEIIKSHIKRIKIYPKGIISVVFNNNSEIKVIGGIEDGTDYAENSDSYCGKSVAC